MSTELRGHIEEMFDQYLKEQNLRKKISIFKYFHKEGVIDSVRSAVLGDVWGYCLASSLSLAHIYEITSKKTIVLFDQIYRRRIYEIKTQVDLILNQ